MPLAARMTGTAPGSFNSERRSPNLALHHPGVSTMLSSTERALAEQLVAEARDDGVELVGPDGPLTRVAKSVLEAALAPISPSPRATSPATPVVVGRVTRDTAVPRRSCTLTWGRSRWKFLVTAPTRSSRHG